MGHSVKNLLEVVENRSNRTGITVKSAILTCALIAVMKSIRFVFSTPFTTLLGSDQKWDLKDKNFPTSVCK
jgi:hypothetical protein